MQQRTTCIIIGIVTALVATTCSFAGIAGVFLMREFQSQQEQMVELQENRNADTEGIPVPPTNPPSVAIQPGETVTIPTEGTPTTEQTLPAQPSADASDVSTALTPPFQEAITQHADAPFYQIEAQFDPEALTITGKQTIILTNTEEVPLDEVYLRLYANALHFNEGAITVDDVQLDGQVVDSQLELDETALNIPLPQPLAPGESQTISMRFTTTIPTSGGGYGIFNAANGVFSLYHWHPELAIHEANEWVLHPAADQGDLTNTDSANYVVTLTVPEGYTAVTSGIENEQTANGTTTYQSVGALSRNFAMVISDQFEVLSQEVDHSVINSYYLPGSEAGAQSALDTAVESIVLFNEHFGPYTYPELDITQVEMGGGAAGMESSGLILIGSSYYDSDLDPLGGFGSIIEGVDSFSFLDFVVAHEAAHQWWYNTVGSDAYEQPWIDEGLTNWSSTFFFDEIRGEVAGQFLRETLINLPYQLTLTQGDQRLDQPVDQFNQSDYGAIVYGKGALMYDVLRQELGDETFFAFLQQYYQQHQFGRVDGTTWRQTLADVAGADVADAFYEKWIEGDAITSDDLPNSSLGPGLFDGLDGLDALEQLFPTPEGDEPR